MDRLVKDAIRILETSRSSSFSGVDREQVVAHATLSAWIQHWPALRRRELNQLVQDTEWIRESEPSRWIKQRRIALAKLARAWNVPIESPASKDPEAG